MTVFFLVRHAAHALQDKVMVGRQSGIALSETGRAQAVALAARFASTALDSVVSSPRRRARETAATIADATGNSVEIAGGLDELELGAWTGRTPEDLAQDPRWQAWNARRASHRCPDGETMADVLARMVAVMDALHARAPAGAFALVTHAEPIRAVVLSAINRSFDEFHSVEVLPASVTAVVLDDGILRLGTDLARAA